MTSASKSLPRQPGRTKKILRAAQFLFLGIAALALGYFGYVQAEVKVFQACQDWRLDRIQEGKPASVNRYVKQWIPFLWTEEVAEPAPAQLPAPEEHSLDSQNIPTEPPAMASPFPADNPEASALPLPETLPPSASHFRATSPEAFAVPPRAAREITRNNNIDTAEGSLIGRIEIPRINLRAIVLEGIENRTLRLAVGHLPGTALPGELGNVDIAGHRDTFFRGLKNIQQDDLITLSTVSGGHYRYRVGAITVVSPDNIAALNASAGPGINLITCFPFNYIGSAPKRFIVHADEVDRTSQADRAATSEIRPVNEVHPVSEIESPLQIPDSGRKALSHHRPSPRLKAMHVASSSAEKDSVSRGISRRRNAQASQPGHHGIRSLFRRIFKGDKSS